jgi:hypothetical protein
MICHLHLLSLSAKGAQSTIYTFSVKPEVLYT